MEFFDQPRDAIINEELVNLPIADLLNACQVNPLFDQLCQDRDLWLARIRNEYPEVDWHVIKNPREFYLKQALFGGQIYIHNVIYSGGTTKFAENDGYDIIPEARTLMVTPKIVPYNDLFTYIREIAEANKPAGKEYFIIYSRPSTDFNSISGRPELTQIAYQVKDHITILPGPAQKITLVDILYLLPDSRYLKYPKDIQYIRELINQGQPVMFNNRIYNVDDLMSLLNNSLHFLGIHLNDLLVGYHANVNTAFYQNESKHIASQLRAEYIIPKFPGLSDIDHSGSIEERKRELLNFVNHVHFFNDSNSRLGFKSPNEFVAFQRDYINNMTEDQLKTVEVLRKLISHIDNYELGLEIHSSTAVWFAFDVKGKIVFFD